MRKPHCQPLGPLLMRPVKTVPHITASYSFFKSQKSITVSVARPLIDRRNREIVQPKRRQTNNNWPQLGLQPQCHISYVVSSYLEVALFSNVPNSTASLTNTSWSRPAVLFALVAILAL